MRNLSLVLLVALAAGCNPMPGGPATAVVASVTDGDTITLDTGEKVRYLLMDTPEITKGKNDCYGEEARQLNESLVLGQEIELVYDRELEDRYGRLLAYVSVQGREVNTLLVERGYACVLHIPPNGDDRVDEFMALETTARNEGRGMWGACDVVACDK